jgi:uncharacterized surface protein with fasciclin (FAS1) repeats
MRFLLLVAVLSLPIPMENVHVLENAFGYLEQTSTYRFSSILGELKQRPWFFKKFEELSPVTLFAPTDHAWASLPQYFWNSPELQQERTEMLQYHTVPRTIIFKGISYGVFSNFSTLLQGNDLFMMRNRSGIYLKDGIQNEIEIVAQVMIRNVVVYGIDGVLTVPPNVVNYFADITKGTLYQHLMNRTSIQNVTQWPKSIQEVLNGTNGFTFLLPNLTLSQNVTSCPNGTQISEFSLWDTFKYHLFPQKLYVSNFRGIDNVTSVANQTWTPIYTTKGMQLSSVYNQTQVNSTILLDHADTLVNNGVVHRIDRLLLPHNYTFQCDYL